MTETTGTFVVTAANEDAAVLRDVETGQVHTLAGNPGLPERQVVEGTVAPEPPLGVTWKLREVTERRTIEVVESDLAPTRRSRETAAAQDLGEVTRHERAGEGEVHVVTVPEGETEAAADDVVADEETVARAARLGAVRVEVRTAEGVLSVRYLPD